MASHVALLRCNLTCRAQSFMDLKEAGGGKKPPDFTVLTNRPPQLHEPHLFSEIAAYKCTGGGKPCTRDRRAVSRKGKKKKSMFGSE